MKFSVNINGRKIEIAGVEICKNKAIGLMFSSRKHSPLLFEFGSPGKWSIHSFFVPYSFVAIWIKEKKVIDYKVVKPFTLSVAPKEEFDTLLEIPINENNKEVVDILVGN